MERHAKEATLAGEASHPGPRTPTYPIGSVDSALRLLLMFGEHPEVRIADASKELGVSRSTAHRLMQMLLLYGFVRQDRATKAYRAGPVWVNMGLRGVRDLDIRTVAHPFVQALVDEVKETVQLLALQPGDTVVCIDAIEGPYLVRAAGRVGVPLVPHATAGGRVLLAGMSQERLRALYPAERLDPVEPASAITTVAQLESELARVRDAGYAVQCDELETGVSAIAAPVRDSVGDVNFAIDVVMPTARLADSDIARIAGAAQTCGEQISAAMSW